MAASSAAGESRVSAWNHVRAVLLLPFTNTVLVPAAIWLAASRAAPAAVSGGLAAAGAATAGVLLLAGGLALVAASVGLFVRDGRGTLAPWDPPRELVVTGLYRRCRNPMKLGLFITLLGEAVLFRSAALLTWFALFAAVNVVYIRLSEEPGLERRFGARYAEYRRNVPRWLPRLRGAEAAASEAVRR